MKTIRLPNSSDLTDAIEQGYSGLDPLRRQSLDRLLALRQVKARMLERDLVRARKADDPAAVQQLESLKQGNSQLVAMLHRDVTVAKTGAPAAARNSVLVHGYVWDAAATPPAPAANTRVAVVALDGAKRGRKLAVARTNAKGYYKVAVPLDPAAKTAETTATVAVSAVNAAGKELASGHAVALRAKGVSFREIFLAPSTARA